MTKILTDEDGNKYWMIQKRGEDYEKPYYVLVDAPVLPHPPAKETYTIQLADRTFSTYLVVEKLNLTPDAADKVAKAVEALLAFIQADKLDDYKEGVWRVEKPAIAAREAYQGGSAA